MKRIAAFWGIGGFLLMLIYAVIRLYPKSVAAFDFTFSWYHWLAFAVNILFMAYSEGYKGFQNSYSPRVAARTKYLLHHAKPYQLVLAPLFCMGFFDAPKRRIVSAVILTVMIIILIIFVQRLPQPWRGILDAGVVVGLSWGIVATLIYTFKALVTKQFDYDPEVPGYKGN
jgi:hypothetical protein